MNFDDEKLADEKSISNMKIKYAEMKSPFSKIQEVFKQNKDLLEVGKLFKRAEKFFEYEKEKYFGEVSSFFEDLKKINNLELAELKKSYDDLNDLDFLNPEMIKNPENLETLNQNLAKNELLILQHLFKIYFDEIDEKNKKMLEKMIFRRLNGLVEIFFGQQN